jgi:HSP20 family protein
MRMNVVRWNPFREMEALLNAVSQDNWGNEQLATQDWRPHVEIRENGTHYTIALDVPAVQAKDIHVAVKDRVLTVSGERKDESETKDEKVHRVERRYGRFARSFVLPENANPDEIDANAKDGVLSISIPKRENERPKSIEVRAH